MKMSSLRSVSKERQWQLQEAKNRLSKVVERALQEGPQMITLRGKPTAVVMSAESFEKLTLPRTSLAEFFQRSPLHGVKLDLRRKKDTSREVEL